MNQRQLVVEFAKYQVGYEESNFNNNIFSQFFGGNFRSWCADFVSWCARQSSVPEDVIPSESYVPDFVKFFLKKGQFKKRGAYTPKPGDLIVFDFNGNDSGDHIGIVEKVEGGRLYSIEGNTSSGCENDNGDGVYRKSRGLTVTYILGYCCPAYTDEQDEETEEDEMIYNKISEVPSYGTATVKKLVAKGALKGDATGLNLNETMLRVLVILDRLGKLD